MELVFVHGALVRDGAWWWQRAAELLEERTGIRSHSVLLPSCGEATPSEATPGETSPDEASPEEVGSGLAADAAALRATLDTLDSAIVVGHSYGGTVIAEAGRHPSVAHLVYISSYLPDVGQSQGAIMSGEADPVLIGDNGDGTIGLTGYDAVTFGARFLQDADEAAQREAWARVTGQQAAALMTPTTRAGWHGVDSTYIVCGDDRSTSIGLQRVHAARASRSVELPTGHHPFISRPDLVVEQIQVLLVGA